MATWSMKTSEAQIAHFGWTILSLVSGYFLELVQCHPGKDKTRNERDGSKWSKNFMPLSWNRFGLDDQAGTTPLCFAFGWSRSRLSAVTARLMTELLAAMKVVGFSRFRTPRTDIAHLEFY
ncbi:hypothetical protein FHS21_000016 [Phyllobacterium trifolii]|uniref:Uncharacterized protein n=1 Tax=Phyllobacterium trifolii TaxID=300193 RepID=A0A839U0V0_9HYPH|nr:hypothetical protein [Phyllobacterium trifolii]